MAVLVFICVTVQTPNKVVANVRDPDYETTVVGRQWSWSFNYVDKQAVGGENRAPGGTPADLPTLVVPVNETVAINLVSLDVVRSFWVPPLPFGST